MALSTGQLLDACEQAYFHPTFAVGPDGIDAGLVTSYPETSDVLLTLRGTLVPEPGPGLLAHVVQSWLDWENDLHDEPEAAPDLFPGKVHRGFAASARRLWGVLEDRDWPDGLIVSGHSKGGALAILFGWLLRKHNPMVIAFAAPKVGDSVFCAAYQLAGPPTLLYENPHDAVPLLPPGFDKVGRVVNPPASWNHPFGMVRNHCLKTGYAWAKDLDRPPGKPAAQQRRAA